MTTQWNETPQEITEYIHNNKCGKVIIYYSHDNKKKWEIYTNEKDSVPSKIFEHFFDMNFFKK